MPAANALPEDIRSLADLNALEVRGSAWTTDVARVATTLRHAGALPASRRSWMLRGAAALAVLALVAAVFAALVEVPNIPRGMSYRYARELVESHGLQFQGHTVGQQSDRNGIDVVSDQRPVAGSTMIRGQAVWVDLMVTEVYLLVCRGGRSLSAPTDGDRLKFEKYNGNASGEMTEGSCAWMDRKLAADEDTFLTPLGFKQQLPDSFRKAPGGFLALCAYTQRDDATNSQHLVALSYENYMIKNDNGVLQPRPATFLCDDHMP